jgi:4-oxalocrotonate tautomerase family enzyme
MADILARPGLGVNQNWLIRAVECLRPPHREHLPSLRKSERSFPRDGVQLRGTGRYGPTPVQYDRILHHPVSRLNKMPVIQIDLREGLTDDQKRALATNVTKAVSDALRERGATTAPPEHVHLLIRESRGINFMFGGEHVPEYNPKK